ncbi:hypothetical protein ACIRP7_41740 [Streptomyces sp. NPDC102270]|uniref:hypothetical protein n=1 Tax=Streptomyces sp. NPDC102270 TaxID=3366150 RepID=UPI003815E81A
MAYPGLLGMLRGLYPALEEAAINMGASRWHSLRTLILPLVAPGLVAPFLLHRCGCPADNAGHR